jgi:hypothetical protein
MMEGKWTGQYTYGNDYPEIYIGKSVLFEMNLIQNGIEFYGNFSDDESRHIFQENGVVAGFIEGDLIFFDKQYPKAWEINENGTIQVIEDSIPPLIRYEGTLSENEFLGTWEIHQYYKEEGNEEIFSIVAGTGTWSMRKANQ